MGLRDDVITVPPALRRHVAGITLSTFDGDAGVLTRAPDPAFSVYIRWPGGGSRETFVAGPSTRASTYEARPGPSCLQLRLRPGRLPAGLPTPRDLVDRRVAMDGSGEGLVERVITAAGGRRDRDDVALLDHATALLRDGETVAATARSIGVSERHLRDLFAELTGLSPTRYARIGRIRSVIEQLGGTDLATLAADAGFYDQAHLTREFQRLVGVAPGAYARGRRPPPAPCTG